MRSCSLIPCLIIVQLSILVPRCTLHDFRCVSQGSISLTLARLSRSNTVSRTGRYENTLSPHFAVYFRYSCHQMSAFQTLFQTTNTEVTPINEPYRRTNWKHYSVRRATTMNGCTEGMNGLAEGWLGRGTHVLGIWQVS